MNETNIPAPMSMTAKLLAIIGFCATVVLIVWLVTLGIKYLPGAFSSLAGVAESIQNYSPKDTIKLSTEKTVVNSGESFTISWDDVQQPGTYTFGYVCAEGVTVEARLDNGEIETLTCEETITFPSPEKELTVSILSTKERFAKTALKLSFTNKNTDTSFGSEIGMTVTNATVPFEEAPVVAKPTTPTEPVVTPTTPKPATVRPATPIVTITYPKSDPKGFTDLSVVTTGVGRLSNGVFQSTKTYDSGRENAIKFDIKNIGTKTSGTWTFTTTLPSGYVYKSDVQAPLKPLEHVEFTIGFFVDKKDEGDTVKVTTKVSTKNDTVSKNNTVTKTVEVND